MQKAVILTEGGKNIGFGHITRCLALYQGFLKIRIRPLIVINGDRSVKGLLKDVNCQNFNWLVNKEKILKILSTADIAIIDSYLADLGFYKKASRMVKTPVYVDDNNRLNYPKGIVVNANIYAQDLNYRNKGNTYLLGTQFCFLRKDFWQTKVKKIRKEPKDILITFGGGEHRDFIKKTVSALAAEFPKLNYHIISSYPLHLDKGIRAKAYAYLKANKMRDLMLDCDLCVSAGGQTLHELARVGIPTIGICFAQNQKRSLQAWGKSGFIDYIGNYTDSDIGRRLLKSVTQLLLYKNRLDCMKKAKSLIDGRGTERVIRGCLKARFS